MKLSQLIAARRIFMEHKNDKLSSAAAYRIMKFLMASDQDDAFYEEKRQEILTRYGTKDEDGKLKIVNGMVNILPDKQGDCTRELQELEDLEVESPALQLSIDDIDAFALSITEMACIFSYLKG